MRRPSLLAVITIATASCGCGDLNDRIMGGLFPNTEMSIEESFDAKHPPTIREVVPATVRPEAEATVTVKGTYLNSMQSNAFSTVWMTRSGVNPVDGEVLRQVSTELRCRFDLTGKGGVWDVHVKRFDGAQAVAEGALTVGRIRP